LGTASRGRARRLVLAAIYGGGCRRLVSLRATCPSTSVVGGFAWLLRDMCGIWCVVRVCAVYGFFLRVLESSAPGLHDHFWVQNRPLPGTLVTQCQDFRLRRLFFLHWVSISRTL
ncbi:unnamed protein product, partial [Ectocarpus sp. 4 AP-2014]